MSKNTEVKSSGFTIVELLIVIVVISILAAVSFVAYRGIQERAREASLTAHLRGAAQSIESYAAQHDKLPVDLSETTISKSNDVDLEYSARADGTFCLTGTIKNLSMKIDRGSTPTKGACPGHSMNGVAAITNFVPNPSFEIYRTGWGWQDGGGYSGSISTAQKHSGNSSFAITAPSANVQDRYIEAYVSAGASGTYTISGYVYLTSNGATSADRDMLLHVGTGSGSNSGSNPKYDRTKLNQWQRVSRTITFNTPTSSARIRFYAPLGGTTYIDSIMLTPGNTVPAYRDGDSPNWIWTSAAHNSPSRGAPL